MMLRTGYRSTVTAPIVVAGTPWGAVSIGSEDPLPPGSEVRLGAFCELVSLAVASAQARADLQASRTRIVRAGDEQRRKLERNLHDGAQQRLVAAAITVRGRTEAMELRSRVGEPVARCRRRGARRRARRAARAGAGAPSGRAHRLRAGGALRALGTRLPLPVEFDVTGERLGSHVEATAYFIVSETLTNVVKHAEATPATVTIGCVGDIVRVEVGDDGSAAPTPRPGPG